MHVQMTLFDATVPTNPRMSSDTALLFLGHRAVLQGIPLVEAVGFVIMPVYGFGNWSYNVGA